MAQRTPSKSSEHSQDLESHRTPSKSRKDRNIHSLTPKQKAIHHQTVHRHLSNRRNQVPSPIHSQSGTDRSPIKVNKYPSQSTQSQAQAQAQAQPHGDFIQEPDFKFDEDSQSRTHSVIHDLPNFTKRGKTAIRKNRSAPHLSAVQQEKVESQLYLHPTQIPRSLSATFANYRPDTALTILMDLPMMTYMGIGGGSVKSMLHRALKQVDDEINTLDQIIQSDSEEVDELRMDTIDSKGSQGIPTAPDAIPPTMIEQDIFIPISEKTPPLQAPTVRKADIRRVDSRAAALSVKHDIEHTLQQGYTLNLIIAVCQALIGAFLYGWNVAILNVPSKIVQRQTQMTQTQYNLLATMFCAGGLIGALIAGPMQDKFGRKSMLLVVDVICIISATITYLYATGSLGPMNDITGYILFWFGRMIIGVACGAATAIVPTYLGEIAPPLIRGAIGTSNQLCICLGIVIVEVVGYKDYIGGEDTWQYLFVGNAIPLLQLLTLWTFPESPKWLVQQGREIEARKALQRLRQTMDVRVDMMLMKGGMLHEKKSIGSELSQKKYKTPLLDDMGSKEHYIEVDLDQLDGEYQLEKVNVANGVQQPTKSKSIEIASSNYTNKMPFGMTSDMWKAVKWATIIAIMLMFMQQMCGINAIFYYSATILNNAGITSDRAVWLGSVGISTANFFAVFIAVFSIDRAGRKLLLITSAVIMIFACIFASIAITFESHGAFWQFSSIIFLVLFVIGFEIGLGPIPWLMMAELSPMQYRGVIVSMATGANWSFNLLIAQFSGSIIGALYFYPFAVVCFVGIIFTIKYIPETNGKTASEIQKELINM